MNESKHTPGPWENGPFDVYSKADIEDGGNIVCEAPQDWEDSMYRWEANARLIAAAPELLEACEAGFRALYDLIQSEFATSSNPHPADSDPDVALLRAAIAKARGEEK